MEIEIPVEYQIILGTLIGGLIIALFRFINSYRKESKNKGESPRLAIVALILGLLIIIPFASVLGLILALISLSIKKYKLLSKIALIVNLITLLPWIAVLIFGP